MKKLFLLLTAPFYCLIVISCNDNSQTETKAVDSLKTDSGSVVTSSICAPGDSSTIGYWQIADSVAEAMIRDTGRGGGHGNASGIQYRRPHIDSIIKHSFGKGYLGFINARYRAADEERYRTARCIPAGDSAGLVANYFTRIVKVNTRYKETDTGTDNFEYYDIVTICPPPDPCPYPIHIADKKK